MRVTGPGPIARTPRTSRFAALIAATVLVSSLAGCGGDGGGSPTPVPSSGPTRQQAGQGTFNLADSDVAIRQTGIPDFGTVAITLNVTGTLEAIVDWSSAANDIDVYFFRGNCNPTQILAQVCGGPFAQSESATAKPERLSATGLSPGAYTLVIASVEGNSAEAGSYQIFVTS
jgi:hypothetical protein